MTREEAKDVFLNRGFVKVNGGEIFDGDKWRQSVVVISELLEQEPCDDLCKSCDTKGCIFQSGIKRKKCDFYTSKKSGMSDEQTCEDAISRAYIEPLVEELENICINGDEHVLDILSNIKNAPSVAPQQKVGKWIHREDLDYIGIDKVVHEHYMCKDCGLIHDFLGGHTCQYNYCPQCGSYNGGNDNGDE